MSFTRRTFPEVLDNLLSDITGGVAAEAHPFPPPGSDAPPYRHSLQQPPASDIISLYGVRNGESHLFRKGVDYALLPDHQTVAWIDVKKGAQLPDPGTLLYINYYPAAAKRTLSDLHVGSVLRTLTESISLEIGRLYAQLQAVYDAGYIDTATGSSLDNVVSLLGIERVRGGRPAGEVEFSRVPGSRGAITVPAGTRVMTADGKVQYETLDEVTLASGQDTVRVGVRSLELGDPLPAGSLVVLPLPIGSIGSVTNPKPTAIATDDESDAELRTRAKSFLHGSERATKGAIEQALALQGISAVVTEDAATPGIIRVSPRGVLSPEQEARMLAAVNEVRPAGVHVDWGKQQAALPVDMQVRLATGKTLIPADRRAVQRNVRERLGDYLNKLGPDEQISINKVVALVSGVNGVEDMALLSARANGSDLLTPDGLSAIKGEPVALGNLAIADPDLPTQLDVVVTFPSGASPADQAKIGQALNDALAYLNKIDPAPDSSGQPQRTLGYDLLLLLLPLPVQGKPQMSLADYDGAPPAALPTAASVAPYAVTFVFTQESRQSQVLAADADGYGLQPYERLVLNGVQVKPRSGNG
jgi:uncharacterized phage protein gp47/JayE